MKLFTTVGDTLVDTTDTAIRGFGQYTAPMDDLEAGYLKAGLSPDAVAILLKRLKDTSS